MVTLREFLKMIGDEQYRIYQPNRDCLIFESFFKVHSPYYFDHKKEHLLQFRDNYWNDNDYCRGVYTDGWKDPAYDEETAEFLDHFGDYEVFSVECSSFRPVRMFKDKKGNLQFDYLKDERRPEDDYLHCFDIFIIGYDKDHHYGCDRCHHSLLKKDKKARDGYSRQADPKDIECKNCWRYIHKAELENK